ncbi:MAG: NAD(P)/FAD-dependent oxidoreductase [Gemmataceae bacterium]
MPTHFVIVGSGIAGLSAAEELCAQDSAARISLISEEAHDFYSRPGLAYLLRGDVPEKQLHIRTRDDARSLCIQRINAHVERLLCHDHELVLSNGQRVRYDRLLLATGALAVPPPFPGGDLAGVVKLDGLDDTRHILKLTKRARTAVVIGGGITALELVEGLSARGLRVHYFLRGVRYWSDVLDEIESRIIMERLRAEGVVIHTQTQVQQAIGQGGKVVGVATQNGEYIPCQILAVAIGVRPRVDLARQAGLTIGKGIVVDSYLRTSAVDVFAAGDVAEVINPDGTSTLDVLWPTALAQGRVAGANMAGATRAYVKSIPSNVTMLTGLKVTIIGAVGGGSNADLVAITRGESEAWRLFPGSWVISDSSNVNRVRLVIGTRAIVGALVMGDQTWARPLQRLVAGHADITPIRSALHEDRAAALTRLADFYHRWEQARTQRGNSMIPPR